MEWPCKQCALLDSLHQFDTWTLCHNSTHRIRDLKHGWVVAHDTIAATVARHFWAFLLFSKNSLEFVSLNGFNSTICRYAAMLASFVCSSTSCNRILSSGGDVSPGSVVAALGLQYKPEIASSTSTMTQDDDITLSPALKD
jgi:hypothetical protein